MFSNEPRCRYQKAQLAEVICQFRFPEILTIETELPARFQEAIRQDLPVYSQRKESAPPAVSNQGGRLTIQTPKPTTNYQFATADNVWRVNLTSKFISLATSNYTCWEDFAAMLDKPLAAFIQIYKPAFFERVGLRYLNFFNREDLGLSGVPYRELIETPYLGILSDEEADENSIGRSTMDVECQVRGGCRLKLHAGPGMVKTPGLAKEEPRFVLDIDLYMPGNVPVNLSAPTLQMLHSQAFSVFRGAITDTLHDAMEPEEI